MHKIEPRTARTERIVTRRLEKELLIYDLDTHKAHHLNESSLLIWEACDGTNDIQEIQTILNDATGKTVSGEFVQLGIKLLDENDLLREPSVQMESLSRRELVRMAGLVTSVALPAVFSVVAPTAIAAQSGLPNGSPCQSGPQCASGNCVGIGGGLKECR